VSTVRGRGRKNLEMKRAQLRGGRTIGVTREKTAFKLQRSFPAKEMKEPKKGYGTPNEDKRGNYLKEKKKRNTLRSLPGTIEGNGSNIEEGEGV